MFPKSATCDAANIFLGEDGFKDCEKYKVKGLFNNRTKALIDEEIYFRNCSREDFEQMHKGDLSSYIDLVIKVIPQWKDVKRKLVSIKEKSICPYSGSKSYIVSTEDKFIAYEYKKLVFHSRNLDKIDPFAEQRICDAQKTLWKQDLTPARFISGKDWYIEPYTKPTIIEFNDTSTWIELIAKLHNNVKIDWFEEHKQSTIQIYPKLSYARSGSHIWPCTTKPEWFNKFADKMEYWQNAGLVPLSEAAKRIVTCHGNLKMDNTVFSECMKPYLINFEFTCCQFAVYELACIFEYKEFGTQDPYGRKNFCREYLIQLDLPHEEKDVELLLFDIQCQRQRCFLPNRFLEITKKSVRDQNFEYNLYKQYEDFERIARKCDVYKKEIVNSDFYSVAHRFYQPQIKFLNKQYGLLYSKVLNLSIGRRRSKMSYEEEVCMNSIAFTKGVIRIETNKCLTWNEANQLAIQKARGLCTKQELMKAGVNSGHNVSLWMYVKRNDHIQKDAVQIGNIPSLYKKNYVSYYEKYNDLSWLNESKPQDWRPLNFIYARKCPQKNVNYINIDEKQDIDFINQYVQSSKRKLTKIIQSQFQVRRKCMSKNEESKMLDFAWEKGILRIYINRCINWKDAKEIAQEKALRLPTIEELEEAKIVESDETEFWTYVFREDGKQDVAQLGILYGYLRERYFSYTDNLGPCEWLDKREPELFRPSNYFYAKRCLAKNEELIKNLR